MAFRSEKPKDEPNGQLSLVAFLEAGSRLDASSHSFSKGLPSEITPKIWKPSPPTPIRSRSRFPQPYVLCPMPSHTGLGRLGLRPTAPRALCPHALERPLTPWPTRSILLAAPDRPPAPPPASACLRLAASLLRLRPGLRLHPTTHRLPPSTPNGGLPDLARSNMAMWRSDLAVVLISNDGTPHLLVEMHLRPQRRHHPRLARLFVFCVYVYANLF